MTTKTIAALLLAALTATAHAQTYTIRLDTQYPDQPLRDITLLQGGNASIDWELRENGSLAGASHSNDYVTLSVASTATADAFFGTDSATAGSDSIATMTLGTAQTDTNGVFWYVATWRDAAGGYYYSGTGTCTIVATTATGAGSALTLSSPINWDSYTHTGTLPNANLDADLQTLASPTAWRLFYSDGSAGITELALGAAGTVLESGGASAAPVWGSAGSGDITAVNITAGTGLTGTVETDTGAHTQTLALTSASIASLALADSATQPGDDWTNTVSGVAAATIESGAALGATALQAGDVGTAAYSNAADFATGAEGDLASTALQAEADTLQSVVTRGGTVTSGVVTIDVANARTNTFGGLLTVLGSRVQSGTGCSATGVDSHAEGSSTTASGNYSHAEGYFTVASGDYSHAEGRSTTASGDHSHAEGRSSTASGDTSHAEGGGTASGNYSHAEGFGTTASGDYSHAAGQYAIASNDNTYVWSDGTDTRSTTTNQFTVYASNGIRLLGGPTEGVAPTAGSHFVTKTYGDANYSGGGSGGSGYQRIGYTPHSLDLIAAALSTESYTNALGVSFPYVATDASADEYMGDNAGYVCATAVTQLVTTVVGRGASAVSSTNYLRYSANRATSWTVLTNTFTSATATGDHIFTNAVSWDAGDIVVWQMNTDTASGDFQHESILFELR